MTTYTNESLDKLYKKDLIPIVLSLQNKLDEVNNSKTELLDEICMLNDKYDKLQPGVHISKNVHNLLSSRLVDIDCQCWVNSQYSRSECLHIVGITKEVKDETLEESVIGIFDKLRCSIDTGQIETCHQVS